MKRTLQLAKSRTRLILTTHTVRALSAHQLAPVAAGRGEAASSCTDPNCPTLKG